jgi:hypothetical protein
MANIAKGPRAYSGGRGLLYGRHRTVLHKKEEKDDEDRAGL